MNLSWSSVTKREGQQHADGLQQRPAPGQICEWCGHDHAKDALCASRPKWSRRGFLALFGAGIAGAVVAAKIPFAEASGNGYTVGGINRATFSFWRNQQSDAVSFDSLRASMRDVYNKCSAGDGTPDLIIIPSNPEMLKRYVGLSELIR